MDFQSHPSNAPDLSGSRYVSGLLGNDIMTTKKVSELTDEELNVQCALAQGWKIVHHLQEYCYSHNGIIITNYLTDYQPTANTEAGRSQCFELMVKFNVEPVFMECTVKCWVYDHKIKVTRVSKDLIQRAICEAVVMSVKGEEVEL